MSISEKKRNRLFWIIQITFTIVFLTITYITLYRPLADVRSQFEDVIQRHERAITSQKEKASKSVAPAPRTQAPDQDTEKASKSVTPIPQTQAPDQDQNVHPSETKNSVDAVSAVAEERDLPDQSVPPVVHPSENDNELEEHKALIEAAEAVSAETEAKQAEMLAAFEPMIPQLVAGLNELSADEQLAVIKQMRSNLRELFSSDPTVTEATLDEMTDIFIRKMEAEGFIRRF